MILDKTMGVNPDDEVCLPPFGIRQPDGRLEMRGGYDGRGGDQDWRNAYDVAEQIDDLLLANGLRSASVSVARAPERVLVMLCQDTGTPEETDRVKAVVRSVYPEFPDANFVLYTQTPVDETAVISPDISTKSVERGVLLDVTAAFPQFEAKNISLVAEQSNRSYKDAAVALCRHGGDVVDAIMELMA